MSAYDAVIIGGGPGGYVAAIRAAQLGLTVACVDKRPTLGGTCLNVGCIPSKALLQSSWLFDMAARQMGAHGIDVGTPGLDLGAMMQRKEKVVGDLTKGITQLFKKNGVTHVTGTATLKDANTVSVAKDDGSTEVLETRNVVLATGSESAHLPGLDVDERRVVTSTGALALERVPGHLVVVGAGVIGLELGSVWRRLGAQVTVVEYLDRILPTMDGEVSKTMQRTLKKQGLAFRTGQRVTGAEIGDDGVTLSLEPVKGGEGSTLEADTVLVAVGRRPNTDGLGLDAAGVATDERGFIPVDDHFRTGAAGVYAIGDVVGGQMLAHKAEDEGVAVAEILAGQHGHIDYDAIPSVVYTHPEAAGMGATEEDLKEQGADYVAGRFPMSANSRARAIGDTEGFVKILAHAGTDEVLGCHIVAPEAGDLISEVVLGREFRAASEDIARTCHAHPQLGEAVKEAALDALGRAIHA